MNGNETFLARWSRRKRGAAAKPRDPAAPQDAAPPVPPGEAPPAEAAPLPPIESIGAGTDITAFLAAGVPAELTRAALRRAWSTDPAIRDFIGLSENSWDFTAPDGVPGFGTVTEAEVRRLLERLSGEPEAADPERPAEAPAAVVEDRTAPAAPDDPAPPPNLDIAAQHETEPGDERSRLPPHRHGGALPK
jgi:hypothetical protein